MHVVFHPFAYPLKPLTQASISMQHIPILHATHNNVLPYPGVLHREFLFAVISSGCLTPGIPLRHHSIRVSHSRNSSPPPFHLGVSLPELLSAAIPSGCLTPRITPPFHQGVSHSESFSADIPPRCLTPGILLRRHSTQMSHTWNPPPPTFHPDASHPESYPPTFHLFRMSHIRNSIQLTYLLFLHP